MKKYMLCLFIIIMVFMCIGAQADSGVGGSVLTWTLQDGVLTISGKGAMDNYNYDNMGQVDIPVRRSRRSGAN